MDSSQKATAIPLDAVDRAADLSLPRVLFVLCDRSEAARAIVPYLYLATGLKSERWLVGRCPVPAVSRHRLRFIPTGGLVGRIIAKMEYLRNLIGLIPQHHIIHLDCGTPVGIVRLALPALVLAKFFGKKVVVQFHSAQAEQFLEHMGTWFYPILRTADKIVVGSRYLQKVVARARLQTVRMAAPVALESIIHSTISQVQPNILMNCPLEREHNVGCALKAFRLAKQKYPRSELTIVGGGSQQTQLQQLVTDGHIYGVKFIEAADSKTIYDLYHQSDVFLHSASIDDSPVSIVLAFAAGLPVVTTDADGLLHMVRDEINALVVPVNDHVALADRLVELVESSELTRRLSVQGRTEASKYAWKRVRQDWVNLYNSLMR